MPTRPTAIFALAPARTAHVFAEAEMTRLRGMCLIPDEIPLETFDSDRARSLLASAEILITGWGCPLVDASVLAVSPHLRLVAHAAGSVRGIVTDDVFKAGIQVTHAAAANALPVAEYTLAMIILANKKVLKFQQLYAASHDTGEVARLAAEPVGNFRKTVGIVGASRIGRRVIELLRPFDMHVLLYDPFVSAAEAAALNVELAELDDLLARSDVVSLHAPSLPQTAGMLDRRRIALMRDGTTLINTARGALVEHEAVEAELVSGRLHAIIDVTDPEVLPASSPLYTLDNVLLTPHVAGAMGTERSRLGAMITDEIDRYTRRLPLEQVITKDLFDRMA
jgi:phosphoglycerate dehydrogenase-like enzyme